MALGNLISEKLDFDLQIADQQKVICVILERHLY